MRSGMARVRGITVLPATHTFIHEWNEPSCLDSVSIHQMALPERSGTHPITAHYSFIDLERMKGWVGLVGWRSGWFTHISKWSPISCRSKVGQGKFAGQRPTFYYWDHAFDSCLLRCSVTTPGKFQTHVSRSVVQLIKAMMCGWECNRRLVVTWATV